MIFAIPLDQNNRSAAISLKFARSPFIAIVYSQEKKIRIIENPYKDEKTEVGINMLSMLSDNYGVKSIVGFELGSNVYNLTKKKQIQVIIISKINQSFEKVLNRLKIDL